MARRRCHSDFSGTQQMCLGFPFFVSYVRSFDRFVRDFRGPAQPEIRSQWFVPASCAHDVCARRPTSGASARVVSPSTYNLTTRVVGCFSCVQYYYGKSFFAHPHCLIPMCVFLSFPTCSFSNVHFQMHIPTCSFFQFPNLNVMIAS